MCIDRAAAWGFGGRVLKAHLLGGWPLALGTDRLKVLVEIVEPQLPRGIPPREPKSASRTESDLLTHATAKCPSLAGQHFCRR